MVALMAAVSVVNAQKRPDFSGRWVLVTPGEGEGTEMIIKQTESLLTNSHDSEGGGHRLEYRLDGSEHRTTMMSHGENIVSLSKAVWEGDRLRITEITTYSPDRKLDQTMIWSIDEKGQLVIDLTSTMTGRATEKMRLVHRKLPLPVN
jgi:hypothetical protein